MPGRPGQLTQVQAISSSSDLDERFEALFRDFRQPVLNYLFRLLGEAEQAEDALQESFVKVYRALPRLPRDANVRAWVYRIATNTAYDLLRRRRLIRWLPLLHARDQHDSSVMAPDDMASLEQRLDIQRALNRLPTDLRTPLLLYSYQGLSTAEIAEIMQISRSAVKMRLQRARQVFEDHYARENRAQEGGQP
jgi:RNA polymerase sigma-70 factor (ECF subfamily)